MRDLSVMREGWDSHQAEETRLLRATTIQDSLRQWLRLQAAFEWQLQQTSAIFGPERREALIELQARLRRLVE